jgi:hypothetical protein
VGLGLVLGENWVILSGAMKGHAGVPAPGMPRGLSLRGAALEGSDMLPLSAVQPEL